MHFTVLGPDTAASYDVIAPGAKETLQFVVVPKARIFPRHVSESRHRVITLRARTLPMFQRAVMYPLAKATTLLACDDVTNEIVVNIFTSIIVVIIIERLRLPPSRAVPCP